MKTNKTSFFRLLAKEKLVEELKAEALRPNPDFKAACSTDAALALRVDRLIDRTCRLEEHAPSCQRNEPSVLPRLCRKNNPCV